MTIRFDTPLSGDHLQKNHLSYPFFFYQIFYGQEQSTTEHVPTLLSQVICNQPILLLRALALKILPEVLASVKINGSCRNVFFEINIKEGLFKISKIFRNNQRNFSQL